MRTALDAPIDALDEQERNVVDKIRQHGWFGTAVGADGGEPGFYYSTGFWLTLNFPEVIVFSLQGQRAHETLWALFRLLQAGTRPAIATSIGDIFIDFDAMLLPVATRHYAGYLGWSRWFYGGDGFPCLQLIWPDEQNVFPWQLGFTDRLKQKQPDLTEQRWGTSVSS